MKSDTRFSLTLGVALVICFTFLVALAENKKTVCPKTEAGICPVEKPETKMELIRELDRAVSRADSKGADSSETIIEFRVGMKTTHKSEQFGLPWYARKCEITTISGGRLVGSYTRAQAAQILTRLGGMPSPDSLVLTGDGYPPMR